MFKSLAIALSLSRSLALSGFVLGMAFEKKVLSKWLGEGMGPEGVEDKEASNLITSDYLSQKDIYSQLASRFPTVRKDFIIIGEGKEKNAIREDLASSYNNRGGESTKKSKIGVRIWIMDVDGMTERFCTTNGDGRFTVYCGRNLWSPVSLCLWSIHFQCSSSFEL